MQEDGIGGRHRINIHVGKEAEHNMIRGHRREVVRNSMKDLMPITHSCWQLTPLTSNNVTGNNVTARSLSHDGCPSAFKKDSHARCTDLFP